MYWRGKGSPSNLSINQVASRDVMVGMIVGREQTQGPHQRDRPLPSGFRIGWFALAVAFLVASQMRAQETPGNPSATPPVAAKVPWAFSITVDGYIPPDQDAYVSPIATADHGWLHLEARYGYEDARTGSVWLGYNFTAGKKLVLKLTPMIGGVFGRTTGIAPGCEASLTYKRIELYIGNEYVFDTSASHNSFYYSEPQLTYSLTDWLRVGLTAQRTKELHTGFDVQRGFLVGVSHKHAQFTTYVYNAGWSDPTAVLELGWSF
jgi:hypothetical protein